MNWRAAFLAQARSDDEVRRILNARRVAYSHQLHYLQMVCEKLARAFLVDPAADEPPPRTHAAFVRLLQVIKGRPDIRRQVGYQDSKVFRAFIDSLLPTASRIEALAPSAAGDRHPNPEYPWWDPAGQTVHVPATFEFVEFDPATPQMVKLEKLVSGLLRIAA